MSEITRFMSENGLNECLYVINGSKYDILLCHKMLNLCHKNHNPLESAAHGLEHFVKNTYEKITNTIKMPIKHPQFIRLDKIRLIDFCLCPKFILIPPTLNFLQSIQ